MPRLTKKEEAIRHWTEVLRHRNAKKLLRIGEDDEFEDFLDNYVATQLRKCQHQRFLQRSAYRKMEEFTKMEFSLDLRSSEDDSEGNMRGQPQFLRDAEFLQQYRMSKASLRKLTSKIEKHEVFRQGSRGPKQPPPIYQLMVLLRYLGTDGSGASLPSLRARYKFSAGTARNHKMRALKAVLSLSPVKSVAIHLPVDCQKDYFIVCLVELTTLDLVQARSFHSLSIQCSNTPVTIVYMW